MVTFTNTPQNLNASTVPINLTAGPTDTTGTITIANAAAINTGIINISALNPFSLLPNVILNHDGIFTLNPEDGPFYFGTLNMNGGTINLNGAHLCIGVNTLPSEENALVIEFATEAHGKITYVKNSVDELHNLLVSRKDHIQNCKMIIIPASHISFPILLECFEYIKNTPDIERIHLHNAFAGAEGQKFVEELQIISSKTNLKSISLSGAPIGLTTETESADYTADILALQAETCVPSRALTFSNPEEHQKIQKLRQEFPDKKQLFKDTLPMFPFELCELTFQYAALGVPKIKLLPEPIKKKKKKDGNPIKFS